jgi:hypothetical protein
MTDEIPRYFEDAKSRLKAERDSMVQKLQEDIAASRRNALSKV